MMQWSSRTLFLAGSLAVNLILVGFVVGVGAQRLKPDAGDPVPVEIGGGLDPRAFFEVLSEEQRDAVREQFLAEGRRARPILRNAIEARRTLGAVIVEEPYDAEAVRAALAHVREVERGLQQRGDDVMIEALSNVEPGVREQYLERLRARRESFRRRGGGGGGGGGGGARSDAPRDAARPAPDER